MQEVLLHDNSLGGIEGGKCCLCHGFGIESPYIDIDFLWSELVVFGVESGLQRSVFSLESPLSAVVKELSFNIRCLDHFVFYVLLLFC